MLETPFLHDKENELIIQYSVKHGQKLGCGGGYIKLLPGGPSFDPTSFGGDTPYGVMFGPDICGSTRTVHVIFHNTKTNQNLPLIKPIRIDKPDKLTHLYTLRLKPDNTFEVLIDQESIRSGKLEDEFSFLKPKQIVDPNISKPADWVDEEQIEDPNDTKPEGYDDIPEKIPDSQAVQPEDWNEEDDGKWEPPLLLNTEYEGPWSPQMIDNPDYKGAWEHPMIDNPEYVYDDDMHSVCASESRTGCTHIGFELWQVTSGTIFDDIIVTDSWEETQNFAKDTFVKKQDSEKKMHDDAKEKKKKEKETEFEKKEAELQENDHLSGGEL